MRRVEHIIISSLLHDELVMRKILPHIRLEYFQNKVDQILVDTIIAFINKYNERPTISSLSIDLGNRTDINEDQYKEINKLISDGSFEYDLALSQNWILDTIETFCKDKSLYNAIYQAIKIVDDEKKTGLSKGAIPTILQDALAVCFDSNVGHDFLEDFNNRYEYYHKKVDKIKFDIDLLNEATDGGLPNKTLTAILGGTGAGKSLLLSHFAANNLRDGLNVLYITLELSETMVAERIDANLLDIQIDQLRKLSKEEYLRKINHLRNKYVGKLIIKEYPTTTAGANNFRFLLNELKQKKKFVPHIIYIDYLNICMSSRIKMGANVNSYSYIKAVTEELRGLAIEYNLPVVTATQTNRDGVKNQDPDITNTSDSFGTAMTLDLFIAVYQTEDLEKMSKLMFKQLKNRFSDPAMLRKFVVGVNKSKMKIYNTEQLQDKPEEPQLLMEDKPIMDTNGLWGDETDKKLDKKRFGDFR